jgi:hypothetical protein
MASYSSADDFYVVHGSDYYEKQHKEREAKERIKTYNEDTLPMSSIKIQIGK